MNIKALVASALMAAGLVLVSGISASAATLTADNGVVDGIATPGDTTDLDNAIDGDDSTWFSLGDGGSLYYDVSPSYFLSPASIIEVTFDSVQAAYPESADVYLDGDLMATIWNDGTTIDGLGTVSNVTFGTNTTSFEISFAGGPYSLLTITDTTLATFGASYGGKGQPQSTNGFDISEVAISAVPLPASLLLLGAALGGLGLMRRRAS